MVDYGGNCYGGLGKGWKLIWWGNICKEGVTHIVDGRYGFSVEVTHWKLLCKNVRYRQLLVLFYLMPREKGLIWRL